LQATRILIADDEHRIRKCLRTLLTMEEGLEVVGEAQDGTEVVKLAMHLHPDLVLMDVRMPLMDGAEATRVIKQQNPGCKIVAVSVFESEQRSALEAGADAFLLKDCGHGRMVQEIRSIVSSGCDGHQGDR
jgi:DNA-binding NarL/FixJ family response regulator